MTNAIDADPTTRWSSGTGQTSGVSFTIDTGATHTINGVSLDSGANLEDDAHSWRIYVTNDPGNLGSAVLTGYGAGQFQNIPLPATSGRYVVIVLGNTVVGNWWSLTNVNVFGS